MICNKCVITSCVDDFKEILIHFYADLKCILCGNDEHGNEIQCCFPRVPVHNNVSFSL